MEVKTSMKYYLLLVKLKSSKKLKIHCVVGKSKVWQVAPVGDAIGLATYKKLSKIIQIIQNLNPYTLSPNNFTSNILFDHCALISIQRPLHKDVRDDFAWIEKES